VDPPIKLHGLESTDCPVESLEIIRTRSSNGNGLCVASTIESSTELVTPISISHMRSGWRNAATMLLGKGLSFRLAFVSHDNG